MLMLDVSSLVDPMRYENHSKSNMPTHLMYTVDVCVVLKVTDDHSGVLRSFVLNDLTFDSGFFIVRLC
jgi:hypothetical protein